MKGDTRFNYIVDMSGATGIQGPPGERGPVGPQGEQGPQGETGSEYTVLIQDTEPTEEDNKIWIPLTSGTVMTVPSVDEMNAALAGKVSQPATAGTEGQVLKLDSNLEPVWGDAAAAGVYAEKVDTVLETTLSRGRKANTTVGGGSLAFGTDVEASGMNSVGFGVATTASNHFSMVQGAFATASGWASHAEGNGTQASGNQSHAEGGGTRATATNAHAEGQSTIANASNMLAIGYYNTGSEVYPEWVAGTSYNVGDKVCRFSLGYKCITANSDSQWTSANWQLLQSTGATAFAIGNGTPDAQTGSNALTVDWDGRIKIQGNQSITQIVNRKIAK